METASAALNNAYLILFGAVLVIMALLIFLCLVRAILGPSVADRIVAINMMGTMVMVIISVLAVMRREGYLIDVALIYAMTSFLAVIVFTKVYMGVRLEKEKEEEISHGS